MNGLQKKKSEIINRVMGKYKAGMHKFNVDTGVCKFCGTFIADIKMRLCDIITPDEAELFRNDERDGWKS